jgi:hypothetical protein
MSSCISIANCQILNDYHVTFCSIECILRRSQKISEKVDIQNGRLFLSNVQIFLWSFWQKLWKSERMKPFSHQKVKELSGPLRVVEKNAEVAVGFIGLHLCLLIGN